MYGEECRFPLTYGDNGALAVLWADSGVYIPYRQSLLLRRWG